MWMRWQNFGTIGLFRSRSCGDFRDEEVQALWALQPHIKNRLRWRHLLEASRQSVYQQDAFPSPGSLFTSLAGREQEIVQFVLIGSANWEIAARLGISINTVKMHLQNIFDKLGINRRSQPAAVYMLAQNRKTD